MDVLYPSQNGMELKERLPKSLLYELNNQHSKSKFPIHFIFFLPNQTTN